jgi:hypothetical protein
LNFAHLPLHPCSGLGSLQLYWRCLWSFLKECNIKTLYRTFTQLCKAILRWVKHAGGCVQRLFECNTISTQTDLSTHRSWYLREVPEPILLWVPMNNYREKNLAVLPDSWIHFQSLRWVKA